MDGAMDGMVLLVVQRVLHIDHQLKLIGLMKIINQLLKYLVDTIELLYSPKIKEPQKKNSMLWVAQMIKEQDYPMEMDIVESHKSHLYLMVKKLKDSVLLGILHSYGHYLKLIHQLEICSHISVCYLVKSQLMVHYQQIYFRIRLHIQRRQQMIL